MTQPDSENPVQFEERKRDHIRLSLDEKYQSCVGPGFDKVHLSHEAFPEIDFQDITIQTKTLGLEAKSPFFVSSMTAGHHEGEDINLTIAKACEEKGWMMGVGSQRRELFDKDAAKEWKKLRMKVPGVKLLGNIGLSQAIRSSTDEVKKLVDSLEAVAMFIHTNPLQECIQPEGTPQFKGGLEAVERLAKELSVPVIVKETGCGFSKATMARLAETGVAALDVSGLGGTHWGKIEGGRSPFSGKHFQASHSFSSWGESTVDSLIWAQELELKKMEIWGSGGLRSGLDGAKAIALGARMVGLAQPILQAAISGHEKLIQKMDSLEYELKTALFCTGCSNLSELRDKKIWKIQK